MGTGLVVALTSFARGRRVVATGERLRGDDPIVTANPDLFVGDDVPDGERRALMMRRRERGTHSP